MNYSAKIDLENKIFFRAACLGVFIFARGGILFCPALDCKLRALLDVYNTFFGEENQAFAEEDISDWDAFWEAFIRTGCERGGLTGVIWQADVPAELAWLRKINSF